jgi:hypothetical protein
MLRRSFAIGLIGVSLGLAGWNSTVQAARPLPRRGTPVVNSARSRSTVRTDDDWYGWGLGPYLYYKSHGASGIQGPAAQNPFEGYFQSGPWMSNNDLFGVSN